MIIPVRCFTCGKVIADKYQYYVKEVEKIKSKIKGDVNDDDDDLAFYDDYHGKILDDLGLSKICCRRHMLGHVDLIETI